MCRIQGGGGRAGEGIGEPGGSGRMRCVKNEGQPVLVALREQPIGLVDDQPAQVLWGQGPIPVR